MEQKVSEQLEQSSEKAASATKQTGQQAAHVGKGAVKALKSAKKGVAATTTGKAKIIVIAAVIIILLIIVLSQGTTAVQMSDTNYPTAINRTSNIEQEINAPETEEEKEESLNSKAKEIEQTSELLAVISEYNENSQESLIKKLKKEAKSGEGTGFIVKHPELIGVDWDATEAHTFNQELDVSVTSANTLTTTGKAAKEKAWATLKELGFSDAAAAGVIGNIQQEKGDWDCSSDGAGGLGLFQLTGGRRSAAIVWCQNKYGTWKDVGAQIDYMMSSGDAAKQFESYTGKDPYIYPTGYAAWWPEKMTLDQFKRLQNAKEAAEIWSRVVERPSLPEMENRKSYAQEALREYSGTDINQNANEVVKNAIAWAVNIANDNSYVYGNPGSPGNRPCPVCHPGSSKMYGCNGFVFAAYAHGGDQQMLKKCSQGLGYGSYADYFSVVQGKSEGTLNPDLLEPGDVIVRGSLMHGEDSDNTFAHVIMYIGNNKIVHAASPSAGILVQDFKTAAEFKNYLQNNRGSNGHKYDAILRYNGAGGNTAGINTASKQDYEYLAMYSISLSNASMYRQQTDGKGAATDADSALDEKTFTDVNGNPIKLYRWGAKKGQINYVKDLETKIKKSDVTDLYYYSIAYEDDGKTVATKEIEEDGKKKKIAIITAGRKSMEMFGDDETLFGVKMGEPYINAPTTTNREAAQALADNTYALLGGEGGQSCATGTGQFVNPLGTQKFTLTSVTGLRIHPIFGMQKSHDGIDMAIGTGASVYAADAGVVTRAEWYSGYGYCIDIDHGNGLMTRYGHLSRMIVKAGDTVSRGQEIAKSGNTGNSTGAHLHFEVQNNGKITDPLPYIGLDGANEGDSFP